jgi:Sulfotransferase family
MVLVSHRARFVYMKTRKTAGTTVEMYFERFCVPDGCFAGTEAVAQTVSEVGIVGSRRSGKRGTDVWQNHMPAKRVRELVGAETWARYLKFTTVRNPYAVVLSSFFWKTDRPYPEGAAALERTGRAFGDYVRGGWLKRRWGGDLEIVAVDGDVQMDMLVRQEHLADDVRAVCERLELPFNAEWLVHTKKTAGAPRRYPLEDFYTPETAAIVRREFD